MENKFGQHEHGEVLMIDCGDRRTNECLNKIMSTAAVATEFLNVVGIYVVTSKKFNLPCKKCLLDTALQFRDIGALLEELANGK